MKSISSRRSFMKRMLAAGGTFLYCAGTRSTWSAEPTETFYSAFMKPPSSARPFYRWWWNGNRITAGEIRRELLLMKQKGAGGVEINPISLDVELYDNPPGVPLDWLSDEWNQMVKVCLEEAGKLDMVVDMIVGTGWPFGGQFLEPEETIQGVELEVREAKGPGTHRTRIDIPKDNNHKLMQLKLFPATVTSLDEAVDVTDKLADDGTLVLELPSGDFQLYILTWRNRFRDVLHGAPGADGPVLDHFNRSAVEKYLNRMSGALNPVLGGDLGKHIRSMFCDSIELEGANWTGDLTDEFEKRRKYRLEPYLPLVLNREAKLDGEFADTVRRVRYDMSKTLAELFSERFIVPFHEWCRRNNTLSRYQAYGHPWLYTDLLDGYLVPDIPESDQWLYNRGWVHRAVIDDIRYAIWNKYASSAGHLAGRKIVSCEAMTNTRGVFRASLEYIKQATDLNIICGINHLVLHGFNYSPPEAGFPGWIRYGTYFNENNPWWPYARYWFDYAARLSYVFQESQPVSQIAILGNTPDKWSDYGLDRNPWNNQPHYLHQLWQALNHYGYLTDYVNATILENAEFKDGEILYGPMSYKLLLVTNMESIELKTAEALDLYIGQGGKIVFIGSTPERSPGLANSWHNKGVNRVIQRIVKGSPEQVTFINGPDKDKVIEWTLKLIQNTTLLPDVYISNPDEKLFFNHQKAGERDIFFLSNMKRDKILEFDASFPTGNKTPWKWDAETGKRFPLKHGMLKDTLHVRLSPLESVLYVFEPDKTGEPEPEYRADRKQVYTVSGPWKVSFEHVNGKKLKRQFDTLTDFSRLPGLENFSGTALYTCNLTAPLSGRVLLDLGEVKEIAEVILNGERLGVKWWGKREFVIEDLPAGKKHKLEIRVTNLLFNYCLSLKDNKAAQNWVNRDRVKEPVPSGLLGPVRIYAMKD